MRPIPSLCQKSCHDTGLVPLLFSPLFSKYICTYNYIDMHLQFYSWHSLAYCAHLDAYQSFFFFFLFVKGGGCGVEEGGCRSMMTPLSHLTHQPSHNESSSYGFLDPNQFISQFSVGKPLGAFCIDFVKSKSHFFEISKH